MQRVWRTECWVSVRHIRGHLLKVAHYELARDAKDCCGYSKRKYAKPATLPHGKGHGEQAYAHEYIDLSRERHESSNIITLKRPERPPIKTSFVMCQGMEGKPVRVNSVQREQHEHQSLGMLLRYLQVTNFLKRCPV